MNTSYLIQRFLHAVLVVFVVSIIAFLLGSFTGDPVTSVLGVDATPEARATLRQQLGLDDPLVLQYVHYLGRVFTGDFGMSYIAQRPVIDVILERVPATLELAFVALLVSLGLGIPLGVIAAVHHRKLWSSALMTTSVIGVSLPTFVVGIFLILIFSVTLGWLPSFGRGEVVRIGGWETGLLTVSGLRSLILPAIALAISQVALVARLVRAEMLEVLRTEYIRFARARGIPDQRVNFGHALRNTLIPIITVSGIQLGYLLAFAVVVEQVFQWPGLGTLFLNALTQTDVPVITAFLMVVATFFVLTNLMVDFLYAMADPRLKMGAKA
ncbi:ABC transporter permease [Rhizobiaceae bacterium BDR2-2]|uniref:ABC transporter permease n=1 Tax=Ectorhizobium quercum TaxID=2965071 RepID=A0AAE3SVL9_9HYPH|nr:ABC transporter permease [Ectorhizobium quercum]MCX8997119.1 ABC transporter permease [Ectorhizobium quercum]